jgi:hypothetical protein
VLSADPPLPHCPYIRSDGDEGAALVVVLDRRTPWVWRDRALVTVLMAWSVLEAMLREDLTPRPPVLAAMFAPL